LAVRGCTRAPVASQSHRGGRRNGALRPPSWWERRILSRAQFLGSIVRCAGREVSTTRWVLLLFGAETWRRDGRCRRISRPPIPRASVLHSDRRKRVIAAEILRTR